MLNKEKIKEQARKLLENFASALGEIKTKDVFVERDNDRRLESEASSPNADFKKRILKNAPSKDEDSIIAEKGSWV